MSTTARAAQLSAVRIGHGVNVHAGHRAANCLPATPRYVAWCGAGRGWRGETWTVPTGEPTNERVDCGNCVRTQPGIVAEIHAAQDAAAMTARGSMNPLTAAVAYFADTITDDYPAGSFACFEIDALAQILREGAGPVGHRDALITLIAAHAVKDTDPDDRHRIRRVTPRSARAFATRYAINTPSIGSLDEAVIDAARTVYGGYPSGQLTCLQADALAWVFLAVDLRDTAVRLLVTHAYADTEPSDEHHVASRDDVADVREHITQYIAERY